MEHVLDERTLVLNRHWTPIRTTTVRDALCLLFKGAARAIEPATCEAHDFRSWAQLAAERGKPRVRTVRLAIRVPEVIVLTRYGGLPAREIVFSRRNLFRRDRSACQYCGARPGAGELTIDHVVPRSQGGVSSWENCVLACLDCNGAKSNRTPEQAGLRLRRAPRRPRWSPSIALAIVGRRRESWEQFVSRLYWDAQLEP
jgi:5-methylcytosine-specific restriction endonuclease McrA